MFVDNLRTKYVPKQPDPELTFAGPSCGILCNTILEMFVYLKTLGTRKRKKNHKYKPLFKSE